MSGPPSPCASADLGMGCPLHGSNILLPILLHPIICLLVGFPTSERVTCMIRVNAATLVCPSLRTYWRPSRLVERTLFFNMLTKPTATIFLSVGGVGCLPSDRIVSVLDIFHVCVLVFVSFVWIPAFPFQVVVCVNSGLSTNAVHCCNNDNKYDCASDTYQNG